MPRLPEFSRLAFTTVIRHARSVMKPVFTKRKLHQADGRPRQWLERTPQERIAAMEAIRLTTPDSPHAQQAFPRVSRITRKASH
jgi:hypothetical protein